MALVVGSLALGGRHSTRSGSTAGATLAALESKLLVIEQRVEKIRGVQFTHRPLPVLVSGAEVRRQGLAELDKQVPPATQAANDELLKLLGLIPPQSNLRAIQGEVFSDQVAGFYDPATKRLALVRDAGATDAAIGEITLAHELTHALDDQRFGIRDQAPGMGDGATAYSALVEGDATSVMTRYATKYMTGSNLLGVLFASSSATGPRLPPYILATLEFPYIEGQRFVDTLFRYGRGWTLVNFAFRFHPPVSTAQILHPLLYAQNVKPLPVRLRVRPLLPRAWRPVLGGTLGEFDTRELIQRGLPGDRAATAAATWRGGGYQLWRLGALPDPRCAGPCRQRDALVAAWRTAPGRDAQTLAAGVSAYVSKGLGGRARGRNVWALPGSAAAVSTQGGTTVLALAPSVASAQQLALRAAPPLTSQRAPRVRP
ncbi:MAG TPA: hypothetical protein VF032_10920 [Thermoleophilaceae bacterium]